MRRFLLLAYLCLAPTPQTQTATTILMAPQTWAEGTRTSADLDVAQGATVAKLAVDVTSMTDTSNSMELLLEVSADSGQTWQTWGPYIFHGKTLRPGGPAQRLSNCEIPLFDSANRNRKLRGTVVLRGPSVDTGATIEIR